MTKPDPRLVDGVERLMRYELRRLKETLERVPDDERVRRILLKDRIRELHRDLHRLRRFPEYYVEQAVRRVAR